MDQKSTGEFGDGVVDAVTEKRPHANPANPHATGKRNLRHEANRSQSVTSNDATLATPKTTVR